MPKEKKDWFCKTCNRYMTKSMAFEHAQKLFHEVVPRIPLEERIIYSNKGETYGEVDGKRYGIIPVLVVYRSPFTQAEEFSDPQLSLMSVTQAFEFVGIVVLSGDIKNLSKRLSLCAGQQTVKISEDELKELFIGAIRSGKAIPTQNPNIVQVLITLNTSLQNKPRDKTSHWVACTWREVENTVSDPEAIRELVGRRMKIVTDLRPHV